MVAIKVAKKRKESDETAQTAQVNMRLPIPFIERLDKAVSMLGIDRTSLVKLVLTEKLHEYERRGREASGLTDD